MEPTDEELDVLYWDLVDEQLSWLQGETPGPPNPPILSADAFQCSVRNLIAERITIAGETDVRRIDDWRYLEEWPVPIGKDSIGEWCRQYREVYGESPERIPQPMLMQCPDALLGLVASRQTENGTVQLLGLMKKADNTWGLMGEGLSGGTELADDGGVLIYPGKASLLTFVGPVCLRVSTSPSTDLDRAERELLDWYTEFQLGRTVRSQGGRRPYESEEDTAQLVWATAKAMKCLNELKGPITPTKVAFYISINVQRWRIDRTMPALRNQKDPRERECALKALYDWRKRTGYSDDPGWESLLADAASLPSEVVDCDTWPEAWEIMRQRQASDEPISNA